MSVGIELTEVEWIRSAYSDASGGDCVEFSPAFAAPGGPGTVPVRDSKSPDGPVLIVSATAWTAFVRQL